MADQANPAEPTLAEVQHRYPRWRCTQAISGLYHAHHPATGDQVTGEDPLDLRDQIRAAQARRARYLALRCSQVTSAAARPVPARAQGQSQLSQ